MGLLDQFAEELAVIKETPRVFAIGFIVLACLIGWVEYTFVFKEWIAKKDSLIETLEKKVNARGPEAVSPVPSQITPSSGSPITTHGPNSPVATGNGNTFGYGDTYAHKLKR